jgi:hypothetical protein
MVDPAIVRASVAPMFGRDSIVQCVTYDPPLAQVQVSRKNRPGEATFVTYMVLSQQYTLSHDTLQLIAVLNMTEVSSFIIFVHRKHHLLFDSMSMFGGTVIRIPTFWRANRTVHSRLDVFTMSLKSITLLDQEQSR